MKISVIYGSVRIGRQGIKAARFVVNVLTERGHDVTLVDPREYKLPLLEKRYKDYNKGEAPEMLENLAELFRNSDAFVVVSAEYNHSIPPALSNLLDYFSEEYLFKPSAIVCYSGGPFGGVRAAVQLRAMLGMLGMPGIPTIFPIPNVQDCFDETGKPLDEKYVKYIQKLIDELEWYAGALSEARKKGLPY